MDRKTQVRKILAEQYPNIPADDRVRILDFIWKEALRDARQAQR